MKQYKLFFGTLILGHILVCNPAFSASYGGIKYRLTLNDVMALYPGAKFEKTSAAWIQPDRQSAYSVEGSGLSGQLFIVFVDDRKNYNDFLYQARTQGINENDKKLLEYGKNLPEKYTLYVDWVRYIPDSSISKNTLITKYGKNYTQQVDDNSYSKYLEWDNGLIANIGEDGNIENLEYSPVGKELTDGLRQQTKNRLRIKQMFNDGMIFNSVDPAPQSTQESDPENNSSESSTY